MATVTVRRGRLRRSDCSGPGIRRIKKGRGFSYLDERGERLEDPEALERIRELAIPPAWREVWICSDPFGHLQATGIDAAGRKQYLYHERWRAHRDRAKFKRMIRFGAELPRFRSALASDLGGQELSRRRVLACAARLLDIGMFRVGGAEYADEEGGIGLATIRKEHVSLSNGSIAFDYPGKGGIRRVQVIEDPIASAIVRALKRRRSGSPELFAYREGRRWRDVRSEDINQFLKERLGEDFSAKDFRTWNATVMAAVALASGDLKQPSKAGRQRMIKQAVRQVAELLGNTPAVARRSYIDPRVIDQYLAGHTIAPVLARMPEPDLADEETRNRVEKAVLGLLDDD